MAAVGGAMTVEYPLVEVAKHRTRDDAWLVLDGRVLDISGWLHEHPGGADILLNVAGSDATRDFDDVGHSEDARSRLKALQIGSLREATAEELEADESARELRSSLRTGADLSSGKARGVSAGARKGDGSRFGLATATTERIRSVMPSSTTTGIIVCSLLIGVFAYRLSSRRT